jgi:hypothetical protein
MGKHGRFLIAAMLAPLPMIAAAQTAPVVESIAIPESALSIPAPLPDRASDPVNAKLHAQLRTMLLRRAGGVTSAAELPAALRRDDHVLVQVDLAATMALADARDLLARHGAQVRNSLGASVHEVWMPFDRLRELAQDDAVASIAPARLIQRLATTSQGVVASNAKYWQTFNPAYTGTGLTIAMIDAFDKTGIGALQSSGDWPASTGANPPLSCFDVANAPGGPPFTATSCTAGTFGGNAIRHGNATLEIAYDVAPGAKYRAYDTLVVGDWYDAILDAANVNATGGSLGAVRANVISASLSAPGDSIGDGTAIPGSIAEAAGYARNRGVLVVNAAGNDRRNHWGGLFTQSVVGGGYHTWTGTTTIYNFFGLNDSASCIPPNTLITVSMYWNNWVQSGGNFAATHDYDIYLYENFGSAVSPNWNVVAASNQLQNGGAGQKPVEYVQYTSTNAGTTGGCSSGSAVYAITVVRAITTSAVDNLQVFATAQNDTGSYTLNYNVAGRSLDFPADSPNVLSVAAIDVANATTTPQEPFSSEGPVLASGGAIPANPVPGTDANLKPDLAGFDDVTTVSLAPSKFFGTSAAAPQVAGMAALFMQRFGVQTSAANLDAKILNPLRAIAATGSNDLGTAGKDYQYGNGRLRFQKESALKFIQQPSSASANTAIAPAITAGIYDAENKLVPYGVFDTLALTIANDPNGGSAVLSGGGNANLVAGIASWALAKINLGGTGYTLKASASAATTPPINLSVTSTAFNITTSAASKLVFTVQPSNAQVGAPITPTIKVSLQDSAGNVVTSNNSTVVTLTRNTCSGVTVRNGAQTASGGVATFTGAALYTTGSATLTASASGLSSATSNSFTVSASTEFIFRGAFETCNP